MAIIKVKDSAGNWTAVPVIDDARVVALQPTVKGTATITVNNGLTMTAQYLGYECSEDGSTVQLEGGYLITNETSVGANDLVATISGVPFKRPTENKEFKWRVLRFDNIAGTIGNADSLVFHPDGTITTSVIWLGVGCQLFGIIGNGTFNL